MQFQRGLIRSYDATTHTAAVLLAGSLSRTILGVPVSQQVPPDQMVEGTPCAVAFFADGSNALVLSTFGSAPEPRVTVYQDTNTSGLTLTTSWQTIPGISIEVAPTEPHSLLVVAMAQVHLRSASATADLAEHYAQIASDGTLVGTPGDVIINDPWVGSTTPIFYSETVTYADPKTYTIQARKTSGTQTKTAALALMVIVAFPTT